MACPSPENHAIPIIPAKLVRAKAGERQSSPMRTHLDPRLRGSDTKGDFHFLGWAAGPCILPQRTAKKPQGPEGEVTGEELGLQK